MLIRFSVFILWLMHFLPFRVLVAIGNALGWLVYRLAKERRRVGEINLRLCFPDMSDAERQHVLKEHFKMFARGFFERSILFWASSERICSLIRVEGIEHFDSIKGKPAILLTPHFVGLDIAGSWISQQVDAVSVYSNQKNRYLNDLLYNKRIRFREQKIFSRLEGLRPIIKELRSGKPFFYLPDQDQGIKDGAFIPFFGVPAATITALPRLASMTKAVVIPCVTRLLPGGNGYVVTFYPVWDDFPSGDDIADTRRMNEFIEQRALEIPEQYFWLHKRFKTRPEGEQPPY
jgi:KDO2-lipid IV(A) lauroyltransferase